MIIDEEIYFKCELCEKNFAADPDTMLECSVTFKDENHVLISDDEMQKISLEANPAINPFLKGAICMCLQCQDEWINNAEKILS